jgi:cell division septal protein FtsQ
MKPSGLLSPRAIGHGYEDIGDRPLFIARQRVSRRSTRRWRGVGRSLLAGALLVLAGAGGVAAIRYGLTAPYFAVASIEVHGASRLSPAYLIETAGLRAGTNIFRVDTYEATRNLEYLPGIRSAEVIRELPNRVTIVVEERRPFTLVHAGRLHWIDEEGVAIGAAPQAVAPSVPVISGLSPAELETMRERPSAHARTAVALIRALLRRASPLTAQISEIDVSRPDGPVLYTVDGVEVRLGTEEWDSRLGRLESVLQEIANAPEAVTSIDLRFRDQVVLNGGPPE